MHCLALLSTYIIFANWLHCGTQYKILFAAFLYFYRFCTKDLLLIIKTQSLLIKSGCVSFICASAFYQYCALKSGMEKALLTLQFLGLVYTLLALWFTVALPWFILSHLHYMQKAAYLQNKISTQRISWVIFWTSLAKVWINTKGRQTILNKIAWLLNICRFM